MTTIVRSQMNTLAARVPVDELVKAGAQLTHYSGGDDILVSMLYWAKDENGFRYVYLPLWVDRCHLAMALFGGAE